MRHSYCAGARGRRCATVTVRVAEGAPQLLCGWQEVQHSYCAGRRRCDIVTAGMAGGAA